MKKSKLIIAIIAVVLIVVIIYGLSSISLEVKSDGEDVSGFVLDFKGCKRYTDDELEAFFFQTESDRNPFVLMWSDMFGEKKVIPFIETYDIDMKSPFLYEITIYEKSVVGYVKYMGSNMYFDKDGIVVESSEVELMDVPMVTGIKYDYIVLHSKIPVKKDKVFADLLNVTQCLDKYSIHVDKINVSDDLEIIVTIGNVKVELGRNDMMNEKVKDLCDILPSMVDVKGTLFMNEYKTDGSGYTFRSE